MSDVESLLNDALTECQPLVDFAGAEKLAGGRPATQLDIRDGEVFVNLYFAGDGGVVVIDYAPGMMIGDTAYCGDIEETHKAVVRLARHTECEVLRDDFDVLAEEAGDQR